MKFVSPLAARTVANGDKNLIFTGSAACANLNDLGR